MRNHEPNRHRILLLRRLLSDIKEGKEINPQRLRRLRKDLDRLAEDFFTKYCPRPKGNVYFDTDKLEWRQFHYIPRHGGES